VLSARPLYLDAQATTPIDPRVVDAMMPLHLEAWGNPHSRTHSYGWEAQDSVETARAQLASLVNAHPSEIFFTSGATESNNLAIKGVARFAAKAGKPKRHLITTVTEHKCVLDSCRALQAEGFTVDYLPVKPNGLLDLELLKSKLTPDTALVSVMGVNNEIGVVQPLAAIGALCREAGVFFHTDAAQMVGKLPVDVNALNVDLMSISGHKMYGPKGIGALYRRRKPRVRLEPIFSGGGQERGLRSGTVPTTLCVGLGAAAALCQQEMARDSAWITHLSKRLMHGIRQRVPLIQVNGDEQQRYDGNLNVSFSFVEGESLLMALKKVALSSGSACTSASLEPSYVLRALGVSDDMAHTSLRFGIHRFTTEAEIDFTIELVASSVAKLRELSPLYEMHQEGIDISKIEWSSAH
jgi:cysteine desulfurase